MARDRDHAVPPKVLTYFRYGTPFLLPVRCPA
jgi:hypothetical protein